MNLGVPVLKVVQSERETLEVTHYPRQSSKVY